MNKFGSEKLNQQVLQTGLCIGCGACIDLCPYFRSHRGRTAQLFPCNREEGRCFAHCPKVEVDADTLCRFLFAAPYNGDPLGIHRSIHISRAGDRLKKQPFQAGGTVTALAYYAFGPNASGEPSSRDAKVSFPSPAWQPDRRRSSAAACPNTPPPLPCPP